MSVSIFEFTDYKAYILARITCAPSKGRGLRRQIAGAMGCQVAYVSHVLAGDRHFSLEQAEAITRFFALREDESEYFLLLVQHNRSGTQHLRHALQQQLNRRREDYQQLKSRVRLKGRITGEDQAIYYSSWHYQAIRMLLTIPQYRTTPAIAKRLDLPIKRVSEVLSFLIAKGLAKETSKGYVTTESQIHLGGDSPLISKLHANWRIHALQSFDRRNPDDLHYSGAVTLSNRDFQIVREIMVKALLESLNVIKPSKEERICALAMDFYEI